MNSKYIESLILRLCTQPRTFEFISMNLNGFDPGELLVKLDNLESSKAIKHINGLWCLNKETKEYSKIEASSNAQTNFFNEHIGFFGLFKKPHPLDFEWRNSTASLEHMIRKIQEINEVDDSLLLLGFPTLFATACIKDIPNKVTLVEKNKPILDGLSKLHTDKKRFTIIDEDIFSVTPHSIGTYHSVMMDPPWYSPHFYQFMWLAAQCVEIGGTIGISLPPINTRPGIDEERVDWFSFSQKQGLCLENLYSQKLHYAMPFFEFNAFRAAGIKDILPFWRKGDFALFRKVHSVSTDRPVLSEKSTEWIEVEISGSRIRVKVDGDEIPKADLEIFHLIKGDILPTVSTRDERRKDANVWTSGNRIYKVTNTEKFIQLLKDWDKGNEGTREAQMVREFINVLTEFEEKEYDNYLDWLYHEMERKID